MGRWVSNIDNSLAISDNIKPKDIHMYLWDTALAGCHELCHALYNKFIYLYNEYLYKWNNDSTAYSMFQNPSLTFYTSM